MPGTSMFLHETVTRNIAKKKTGTQSEGALLATKAKLRDEALATMTSKTAGSKTRARLARLLGMGSIAPAGDDLGSLDPRGSTPKARAAAGKSAAKPKAPGKVPETGEEPDPATAAATVRASRPGKPAARAAKPPTPRTTLRQLPEPEDD